MSAWVVSKAHIDTLVNAAAQFGIVASNQRANAAGRLLWAENVRSVNYRYREQSASPRYRVNTTEAALRPAVILRVLDCYEYQTCEPSNWEKSQAFAWCQRPRVAALDRLPPAALEEVRGGPFRVPHATRHGRNTTRRPGGIASLADIPSAAIDAGEK